MKEKGFTLIELLAVIIILTLLVTLATTSVTSIIRSAKSDLYDDQIIAIKTAAESWGADNLYLLPEADSCIYITLEDLKKSGLMDERVNDPRNNGEISNNTKIKISAILTKYNKLKYTYEVNSKNIDGCEYAYP